MTVYIALLRGINVGGKNKIKMAELRESLTAIGLENVRTYIQSGNILFQSGKQEKKLSEEIEHKIMQDYRLSIPVTLRTREELEQITTACPFSTEEITKAEADSIGESLYVAFFSSNLSKVNLESLQKFQNKNEKYHIQNKEIYLLFHNSIRNSKLANQLQKLDIQSTTRNWKTVNKLAEIVKAAE
ncbi:DUF1697 domain-containing protein [Oceanobacillus neutriphilus]|uniref:DUF1697 domain-containing protein n=1 Tax=Oceanobacillus neutriphilus TaxID=531815 RepID=A0ABQ2P2J9_9BACI|nr:DUF1697 domain-containing protein [Oceanobacillus neutriphilus]GGP16708.1 hypothetical protein GCM10011346_49790 [Oceanobacillus neutriphilus]